MMWLSSATSSFKQQWKNLLSPTDVISEVSHLSGVHQERDEYDGASDMCSYTDNNKALSAWSADRWVTSSYVQGTPRQP